MFKYFKLLIAIIPLGHLYSQFEGSFKYSRGISWVNSNFTGATMFVESDDYYNDINFINQNTEVKPHQGLEFFGGMNLPDSPIIFGMGLGLHRFNNTFSGITTYSDGVQNGDFRLDKTGILFTTTYRLGYKWNDYKTFRPFVFAEASLMSDYSDRVTLLEANHLGFDFTPDVNLYSSIEMNRRFGISAGFEWRRFSFSIDYHRMREQMVYEDDGTLSHKKRRSLSFGISYFIAKPRYFEEETISAPTSQSLVHSAPITTLPAPKKRAPKWFSIIGGIGINMTTGGEGLAYKDADVTFMNVSREFQQISGSTQYEESTVTIFEFDEYSMNVSGFPRFSAGPVLHHKNFELEYMVHYSNRNVQHEMWYYKDVFARYTVNGNSNDWYPVNNAFDNDYEFRLNHDINQLQSAIMLRYKIEATDFRPFPLTMGFGWNFGKYTIRNSYTNLVPQEGIPLHTAISNAFSGESNAQNGQNYYVYDDEGYYLSEQDYIDIIDGTDSRLSPIESINNDSGQLNRFSGPTFSFGLFYGRFDIRASFEILKSKELGLINTNRTSYISLNYHIWGR